MCFMSALIILYQNDEINNENRIPNRTTTIRYNQEYEK